MKKPSIGTPARPPLPAKNPTGGQTSSTFNRQIIPPSVTQTPQTAPAPGQKRKLFGG